MKIQNQLNQNDKLIRMSYRWVDELSADVIWNVFEKVSQSNSRFNALDTLVVTVIRSGCLSISVNLQSRARSVRLP